MKRNLKWIICIISFLIFIIFAVIVLKKEDIYLDSFIYKNVSKFMYDNLTSVIKYLTYLGSALAVISITIFALIFYKNKKYGLFMAMDLIIITLIQLVLKNIFSRGRPVDISLIEESGYSFPSGHSLTAMAFYGLIIYYIYTSKLQKSSKVLFIFLFSFLIFLIGLSRIYLGVHYFTDVIGAFTFSLPYLIIYTDIIGNKLKSS